MLDGLVRDPHPIGPKTRRARFDPAEHPKAWRAVWQYSASRARRDTATLAAQQARAEAVIDGTKPAKSTRFVTLTGDERILDEASLARARRLIGLKGYVTNVPVTVMPAREVIAKYHDLWQVERSFRMSKHDLATRPIYHRTRDAIEAAPGPGGGVRSPGMTALRNILSGLDIPDLEPVPGSHVLTKTFYLLKDFPGRYATGQLWVEATLAENEDDTAMTPERIAMMEAAAAENDEAAAAVLEEMLEPAGVSLDEDVSPVAGRRFQR